jgi:hypothetical protein
MAFYGVIYVPSLMKTGGSLQEIIKYCFRNLSLGAMMYMTSFTQIESGIQKLLRGTHVQTHKESMVVS